ncbi:MULTISPECIES: alpha/beta hydrolase [unclassified Carboxylicivirga]|uniref:alpha/beta hydrolase n=1 Tax=Carboxylicivirga TaxID=1628153 RepID=UPI003D3427E8
MKPLVLFCFMTLMHFTVASSQLVNIWEPNQIPNYQDKKGEERVPERDILFIENVQKPSLEIFVPSKKNAIGMAVLICPGGGYAGVAYDWEGSDYAKWFNSQGIAAFVLKYRMPQAESVITSYLAPIQDAQRAIRFLRYNADSFNIDKNKIGVIGSSAGGHLASTLATHLNEAYYEPIDVIDQESVHPNFMMLIYPVISMKEGVTHKGSRNSLLGKNPSDALVLQFSNELRVTPATPVTFIVHSGNDKAVPVENSIRMYQALLKNDVNTTMHIFPNGGHGYSMGINTINTPDWTELAKQWLSSIETVL